MFVTCTVLPICHPCLYGLSCFFADTFLSILAAIFVMIPFCYLAGAFCVAPVTESRSGARALQVRRLQGQPERFYLILLTKFAALAIITCPVLRRSALCWPCWILRDIVEKSQWCNFFAARDCASLLYSATSHKYPDPFLHCTALRTAPSTVSTM